ncbi:hypothetical protein V5O48_016223 [Marasmius crinis-equi]|uniref:Cytochrome P450 n=1 Tax=Marasmius crinis-equi TaxID=585013 RepID=A0ABR3ESN3_9AGAR
MTGYLGGALLEGGSDTTSQFLHTMILAMIIYSEVQQKAQAELDRVVGPNRLPTLEDFPSLPYVQAIIRETHRIRPVAPLIPHASTALEEYNGYLIPEGSIIFVNIWGIYHDPDIYDDPETFNPERYLKTENGTRSGVDGSDLRPNLQFGCGRRICPGIHLAQNSINLDTMRLLWAFTFSRATDPRNGKDIDVSLDLKNYSKGLITGPLPFKASITPRSSATAETIEREFRDATDTFAKFEVGISQEDREFLEKYRR